MGHEMDCAWCHCIPCECRSCEGRNEWNKKVIVPPSLYEQAKSYYGEQNVSVNHLIGAISIEDINEKCEKCLHKIFLKLAKEAGIPDKFIREFPKSGILTHALVYDSNGEKVTLELVEPIKILED